MMSVAAWGAGAGGAAGAGRAGGGGADSERVARLLDSPHDPRARLDAT